MLSQKTKYALKALAYLAKYGKEQPVLMPKIAEERNIPLRFLENILHEFKKEGLLRSHRGRFGGYQLVQSPEAISVAQIIRICNGPIALLPCGSLNFYEPCEDCDESRCGVKKVIIKARNAVLEVLEKQTLLDLIDD